MESAERSLRFVLHTEIADVSESGFRPEGLNEYFFAEGHPFKKGDQVKVTIQRVNDDKQGTGPKARD